MNLKNEQLLSSLRLGVFLTGLYIIGFTDIAYGGQWVSTEPGEWFYIKDNGQYACDEILLDEKGNIYSFDDTCLMNSNISNTDYYNLSWDENGAWINRMAYREDNSESKFQEYKENGKVYFYDRNEYIDFLNYIHTHFSVLDDTIWTSGNSKYVIFDKEINEGFENSYNLYNNYLEELNNIVNECRGSTDAETVRNISNYISDICSYDKNAKGVYSILNEGKAKCGGYSRFFNMLCDLVGINCEEIYVDVTLSNGAHAMNRVWYDDRWHYIDLVGYDGSTKCEYYYDMDYTEFLKIYTLKNHGLYLYYK